MGMTRQERLREALFRGATLTLENLRYREAVRLFTEELLRADREPTDLTLAALRLEGGRRAAQVVAVEPGVLAGLEEVAWFYRQHGLSPQRLRADGEEVEAGATVLRVEGDGLHLLSLERVGLNLLQRMSGIATATRHLQELVHRRSPRTVVVATRKTPWGLLDKRAVHLGGGGTHRLGLWDAILVKKNHLLLLGDSIPAGVALALRRAWALRRQAAFLEIEVADLSQALAAARVVRDLQQEEADPSPCLLMLDNVTPAAVAQIIAALRAERLWEEVLLEVSGQVSEATIAAYAATGVDAISVGALTHSPRALDLRQRLDSEAR